MAARRQRSGRTLLGRGKPRDLTGFKTARYAASPTARIQGKYLVVEAVEGSDYWEKTLYGFQHDSGHALLAHWEDSEAIEVSFSLRGFSELYHQAGLMLWYGPRQWIKAGAELNDGVPHLGAVVTSELSDWSLAPVPEKLAGPFVCAPTRPRLEVTFTRWSRTEPDIDLHAEPAPPELS